jgi:hypothetical protein
MTCCVCKNPSFDDSPKGALCLPCLLALGELRSSSPKGAGGSYEKIEGRIFSELIFELGKVEPTLADKVSEIIRNLNCIDTKEAAARLNPGEANLALLIVLNVIHGAGAAV